MQPVFTILEEKLKSSSKEDLKEELEAFKAEKPTLWEAIQTHAYKIAEKAVYTQGSTELINLLTQI
ncbi:MAG: hypothetical protein HEP71_27705 [Roseivirga sp.]|nr:hypothetical protein [Roseivirga sp.]